MVDNEEAAAVEALVARAAATTSFPARYLSEAKLGLNREARGEAFAPVYESAVKAAADESMYAALALIDAIRGGNARERELAAKLLDKMVMDAGRE